MLKDYLMTVEEYVKFPYRTPYEYRLNSGNQSLYYFGARHMYDPAHIQFEQLEKFWLEFLHKSKGNSVVFVEGGIRPLRDSKEESIRKGGEGGLITYLAAENKIEAFSPEPPAEQEWNDLLRQFSKEEIFYYYFARKVEQWNKIGKVEPLSSFLDHFLDTRNKIGKTSFSLPDLILIHKTIFSFDFNENDYDFFHKITNPYIETTIINKVARQSGDIREGFILQCIERFWNEGKNLFIVYGASHAIVQKKALEVLVCDKKRPISTTS